MEEVAYPSIISRCKMLTYTFTVDFTPPSCIQVDLLLIQLNFNMDIKLSLLALISQDSLNSSGWRLLFSFSEMFVPSP